VSDPKIMENKAQARNLELELTTPSLEALQLRAHLYEAAAETENLSAELEITSLRLGEAHKAAAGLSRRHKHQATHNLRHYQRCLEQMIDETVDNDTEKYALNREVQQLRHQGQCHSALSAKSRAIGQEAIAEIARLEHELAVRNSEISILRMSEELLQLKLEDAEQRIATYRENNSRTIDRLTAMLEQRSEEQAASSKSYTPATCHL